MTTVFLIPMKMSALTQTLVGAAEGCDLLILLLKIKVKRSQPSAAPAVEAVFWQRIL
jgi:hypothetical protein